MDTVCRQAEHMALINMLDRAAHRVLDVIELILVRDDNSVA